MGLVKSAIERKLSAALGAHVSFEKLNFSLIGKSVEATNVVISAGSGDSSPLLTVKRVKAELSVTAAFKKEIVVKSLTIERPVLSIERRADAKLNLPTRGSQKPSDTSAKPEDDDDSSWKFEARKVLMVDGEVHFRDAGGYRASVEKILAELKTTDAGPMELTVMSDTVGRRDQPVELGQLRMNGRVTGVTDLTDWSGSLIQASVHVGELARIQLDVAKLVPLDVKAQFTATLPDAALLPKLLPRNIPLPTALRGKVDLAGIATFDGKALCVPELSIQARDVRVNLVPSSPTA